MAAAKGVAPIAASFMAPPLAVDPKPAPVMTPTAEATIPPAVVAPQPARADTPTTVADKPAIPAAPHSAARRSGKFSALTKRLPATRAHAARISPAAPPRMPMPPPGFAETGPYQRLVYGAAPPAPFGGWGYRDRYFYYP